MVDLDPQCNTTQFWNPDIVEEEDKFESGQEAEVAAEAMLEMNNTEIAVECDDLHPARNNSTMDAFVSEFKTTSLYKMLRAHFDAGEIGDLNDILDAEDTVTSVNEDHFQGRLQLLAGSQLLFKFERSIT